MLWESEEGMTEGVRDHLTEKVTFEQGFRTTDFLQIERGREGAPDRGKHTEEEN